MALHVPRPFLGGEGTESKGAARFRVTGGLELNLAPSAQSGVFACPCSSHHPPEIGGEADGGEDTMELGHGMQEVPGVSGGGLVPEAYEPRRVGVAGAGHRLGEEGPRRKEGWLTRGRCRLGSGGCCPGIRCPLSTLGRLLPGWPGI